MAERGPVRPPADAEAARPDARRDPLIDPLAVTEHCVIGDQLRLPAACCDIAGCGAEFADPAALGEADNRARALAAGWCEDALGRLVCPACQQNRDAMWPWMPSSDPGTGTPNAGAPGPRGGRSPSARAKVAGARGAASSGRHRRARWLHVLAALAGGHNGWRAPQPATGLPGNSADPQVGAA